MALLNHEYWLWFYKTNTIRNVLRQIIQTSMQINMLDEGGLKITMRVYMLIMLINMAR